MIKKKFCIIGIDNDFLDFIKRNKSLFSGYYSENNRFYKSIIKKKRLGTHDKKNWLKVKKKINPDVVICIDNGTIREKLYKSIYKNNCKNLFFKKSHISETSKLRLLKKKCIIIQDHAKIMSNVNIDSGVKIHVGVQIHHDCTIGKFSTIAPKALLLGNVKIGSHAYIGANATIKQRIKIGKGAIVGAGAVVVKNVTNFDIVVGSPARSIKN